LGLFTCEPNTITGRYKSRPYIYIYIYIYDARKSVGWNALDYGDGFLVLKRKERTIKGDRYNPAKDPSTIKSIFSLEHKDRKL